MEKKNKKKKHIYIYTDDDSINLREKNTLSIYRK